MNALDFGNYVTDNKHRGYLDKLYSDEQLASEFGLMLQERVRETDITKAGVNFQFWVHKYTLSTEPGVIISMSKHEDDSGEEFIRISLVSEDQEANDRTREYLNSITDQTIIGDIEYVNFGGVNRLLK